MSPINTTLTIIQQKIQENEKKHIFGIVIVRPKYNSEKKKILCYIIYCSLELIKIETTIYGLTSS